MKKIRETFITHFSFLGFWKKRTRTILPVMKIPYINPQLLNTKIQHGKATRKQCKKGKKSCNISEITILK